jgi:nitrate reductase (NAD(P)H)
VSSFVLTILSLFAFGTTKQAEGWWYKPDYIINELNINSVISSPAQNETFSSTLALPPSTNSSNTTNLISSPSAPLPSPTNMFLKPPKTPYTLKGYAYTGGGRKITRCEISFNRGKTWNHAKILSYPEPLNPKLPTRPHQLNGVAPRHRDTRYWCWFFWEFEVEDLWECLRVHGVPRKALKKESAMAEEWKWRIGCKEICLRAWDEALNTQPEKPTWNLMVSFFYFFYFFFFFFWR